MKFKTLLAVFTAALLLAACGGKGTKKSISIAYVNWSEGIAITHLTKVILEDQGYDVKLMNADLAPVMASLSRKKADLFMDTWLPVTMKDYMDQYGDKLEKLGTVYDEARIGLVVPDYVTANSIDELNKYKAKFDKKIVGIDAGAGIMRATAKAIKEYNLDFELQTSSGPAMTASLKKAIDKKEWIVITGWTPHWMFNRFALKILKDPKGIYGQAEDIQAIAWKGFSDKYPEVAKIVKKIRLSNEDISSLMADIENSKTNEEDAVKGWIKQHQSLVDSWTKIEK
ncbi:glycine betaine ABC transporter substrate-binding protein [uncultured Bacteroides sp.]|uniref:glycine betaine ABC transporter substrate-binding protein n=1 Tax=uncultured Bacteroides sp. TaxID=162156 RepID=UPI002AA62880|nr:glycine betaine ABC transporter substrate-binding protein [uncultured Bacteroides sp.]